MNVFFTDEAKADLVHIAASIAQTNPARASRVFQELRQRCEGLGDMPHRFSLVPRYEHTGIRRRVVGDYLLFYRVGDASIQILHILHGATDYAAYFLQDR